MSEDHAKYFLSEVNPENYEEQINHIERTLDNSETPTPSIETTTAILNKLEEIYYTLGTKTEQETQVKRDELRNKIMLLLYNTKLTSNGYDTIEYFNEKQKLRQNSKIVIIIYIIH